MEIFDAKESLEKTISNRNNTIKEDVQKRINDAVKNGKVIALCGELYPELEQILLNKNFDIVKHIESEELCNMVYWGEKASGKLLDYTS